MDWYRKPAARPGGPDSSQVTWPQQSGRCEPIDEGCAGYECTCIRHFLFRPAGRDSAGMESRQVSVGARTKTIISGDKHLLKVSGYQGVSVLTPRQFVVQYLLDD